MEYTTIPLWQPKNNDDPDYEDNDLIKFPTNSKSDKVRLFLLKNDVKKKSCPKNMLRKIII